METSDLGSGLTVETVSTGIGKYHITSHVQTLRVALGTGSANRLQFDPLLAAHDPDSCVPWAPTEGCICAIIALNKLQLHSSQMI